MNRKNLLIGLAVGFISGYVTKTVLTKKVRLHPDLILNDIKALVKKSGPISGSWIYMKPEDFNNNGIGCKVYKGGISKKINDDLVHFEFIADAYSGTVIRYEQAN